MQTICAFFSFLLTKFNLFARSRHASSLICGTLPLVLGCAFLHSFVAGAQRIPLGDDVAHPVPGAGHNYIHALSETVNPANGTVSLNIALPVPKGRGLSLPLAITYNSGEVHHFSSLLPGCGGLEGAPCTFDNQTGMNRTIGGWSDTLPYAIVALEQVGLPPFPDQYGCTISTSYNFFDPNGVGHPLGLAAISTIAGNQYEPPMHVPASPTVKPRVSTVERAVITVVRVDFSTPLPTVVATRRSMPRLGYVRVIPTPKQRIATIQMVVPASELPT